MENTTTITKENIEKFKSYGFILTPVLKSENKKLDKKPKIKNGKWFKDWKDEELLSAERLGVFHRDSKVFAIDPDDKTFAAHLFMPCLPPTFEVGKRIDGKILNTQRIYRLPDNVTAKKFQYSDANIGKIIELLPSTQSIIAGVDRIILNNVEPAVVDPAALTLHCKLIATFSELYRHFPKGSGKRDEIHLALAGALVRETDIDMDLAKRYVSRLCDMTYDDEKKKRLEKLDYQKEQLDAGVEDVAGIGSVSRMLGGVNLPAFDLIKKNVKEEEEFDDEQYYPIRNFGDMINTDYPNPKFLLDPIVREKTVVQISGDYGAGKTQFGIKLAICFSSGLDFLEWKNKTEPRPVLYVEGELPAVDIRDRIISMTENLDDINNINENKQPKFKAENLFLLTLDDLELGGFEYGFERLAVTNNEDGAAKGRILVENTCDEIKKRTGKYPILFLDNISALTSIDENKAQDWSSLVQWFMKLKTKGIVIIYFHHLGKSTGTASGSNMALRLVDTHLVLRKLPPKSNFEMKGKNVQCSIEFDKCRNFGGTAAKPFILTCSNEGEWKKYPMLDQKDFLIIGYLNEGKSVKQMCEDDERLKESTVGRRILKLEKEGIIKR
jgi:hypothetical protein